jgi:hypothetical protein
MPRKRTEPSDAELTAAALARNEQEAVEEAVRANRAQVYLDATEQLTLCVQAVSRAGTHEPPVREDSFEHGAMRTLASLCELFCVGIAHNDLLEQPRF